MLELLAELPRVQTRAYANGFLVRHDADEWYFSLRSGDSTHATGRDERTAALGLPPPNVYTVELWGFRGVRTIHGRTERDSTPEERQDVARIQSDEPLLWAGHVGVSFDGGRTIWGFLPQQPTDLPLDGFIASLRQHEAYPGVVGDDTAIFRRAEQLATDKGWGTRPISAVELVDKPKKLEALDEIRKMSGMKAGEHGKGYSFPLPHPVAGHHYRESNEYAAKDTANCARFPELIGVPIPEPSGNLRSYIPELEKWSQASDPIDTRTRAFER